MSFTRVFVPPEVAAEVNAANDSDVARAVVDALIEIERNLEFGRELEANTVTGDLRGCRKVYVDKATDAKPRYRLVYWLAPSEAIPRQARVLAFGERKDLAAYTLAVQRYNTDRASQGQPPVETMTDQQLGLGS